MEPDLQAMRQALVEQLAPYRTQGLISEADEAALIRHMEARSMAVCQTLATLAPEHERIRLEAGLEAADAWLIEALEGIGQQEALSNMQLLEQLIGSGGGS